MPARCNASSPCARRQAGAAVILALLTLALVAGLAAAAVRDYGAAVASLAGRHDLAQARLLARGAIDWARNVLAEDARTSSIDYTGEAWATRVPPTPVEEGEVSGELADLSGRFDLNSVAGGSDSAPAAAFARLLTTLGLSGDRAAALASALAARVGGVPGSSAAAPLIDVDELPRVAGFDDDVMTRLRPLVVALPALAPLNVNTAEAEVLAALLPELGLDAARALVVERQRAPFKDLADFQARLPAPATVPANAQLAVTSRYFLASGRARFGEAATRMQVLLDRQATWPEIVWQKIL